MRPWIVSFVVVALCVGTVLWVWRDDAADRRAREPVPGAGSDTPAGPARPILTENDVRAYLDVYARVQDSLGRSVQEAARSGQAMDGERFGAEMSANVASWLKPYHLSLADWDGLRERVGFVVDCERWERDRPERERQLRETIETKKAALEAATTDTERETLRREIERFEGQFGAKAGPVADADLELVRSFWAELDRVAPRTALQRGSGSRTTPDRE